MWIAGEGHNADANEQKAVIKNLLKEIENINY
jgi:hypothetical protein